MRQHGFSQTQRELILKKVPSILNSTLTTDMYYLFSKSNSRVELKLFDSRSQRAWLVYHEGRKFNATEFIPNYQVQRKTISSRVVNSVYSSVLSLTKSNWVASRFIDSYSMGASSSLNVSKNARFTLTLEKKFLNGHFIKYGEVLKTQIYDGKNKSSKTFVKIGRGGLFLNERDLALRRELFAPVDYLRISSRFQPSRRHPITRRVQPHLGVDFELPYGEPVYAAKMGTIVRYGFHHAAGNFVVIMHGQGIETSYNHLKNISPDLRVGLRVSGGQKIGSIGCTGYCTKAHLHFAVRKKGKMVNPLPYLNPYPMFAKTILQNRLASN